ncbi:hypothetical protein VN97_g10850 [Penicillium thymicola]|uniref:Uncharacterized protein n=1 Tax=Penicillium thymicola TaxID=293382 RepID=A0AAI9X3F4_PENTH|nr:hypothetical protein VN97_g10850 [Penicillium thymicola]
MSVGLISSAALDVRWLVFAPPLHGFVAGADPSGSPLEECFNYDQVQPKKPTSMMPMRPEDRRRRLPQHISRTLPPSSPSLTLPFRPSPRRPPLRLTHSPIPICSPSVSSLASSPSLRQAGSRVLGSRPPPPAWLLDHIPSSSPAHLDWRLLDFGQPRHRHVRPA